MKKLNFIFLTLLAIGIFCIKIHAQRILFIAAGQSNAVGMADSSLSVQVSADVADEYKYKNNCFTPIKDPVGENELNFERAKTGSLWPSFSRSYHNLSHLHVCIIPAARGGSSCNHKAELGNMGTWDTIGRLCLLDNAIKKTKAAEALSKKRAAGVIWLQGERDANAIFDKQLTADEYEYSLRSVIERFRKGLGYDIPFYIVLTGNQQGRMPIGNDAVRRSQENIAKDIPQVYIVYSSTKDFEREHLMKDFVHYSQAALNQMGQAIAKNIWFLKNERRK